MQEQDVFCYCCECHEDCDLFSFVEGKEVCKLCRLNNSSICSHRQVNDLVEFQLKVKHLLNWLLEDRQRCAQDPSLTLEQLLPNNVETLWFVGYNDDKEEICTPINLKHPFNPERNPTQPLQDYCRALIHSEENEIMLSQSTIQFCPEAILSTSDMGNIDFTPTNNAQSNEFKSNVIEDLVLRGYRCGELIGKSLEDVRELLQKLLSLRRKILFVRNAIIIEQCSKKYQIVPVSQAILCILHCKKRTCEKMIEQLLLTGLNTRPTNALKKEFIKEAQKIINHQCLGQK